MFGKLLFKILIAPALIGLASWIARRWGPAAGGWFVALPLTSGPVVLVIAVERGPVFAREACVGVTMALVSLSAFALAYGWSARRMNWWRSSLLGCAAYTACTYVLQFVPTPPISGAFAVTCVVLAAAIRAMPAAHGSGRVMLQPAWDIPLRMVLAAALVWGLASTAQTLGPRMSGLLAPLPIATTILAASTHRFEGFSAVRQFLHGLLKGLFSFAVFMLLVEVTISHFPIRVAFAAAVLGTLLFHAVVWRWVAVSSAPGSVRQPLGLTHE